MEKSNKGNHTNGQTSSETGRETLRPLNNGPSYRGLYVVTTYNDFFKPLPGEKEKGGKRTR